jgi:hypothetical protein
MLQDGCFVRLVEAGANFQSCQRPLTLRERCGALRAGVHMGLPPKGRSGDMLAIANIVGDVSIGG